MIYSSACAYAIRAMTWMALGKPESYMLLEDIHRQAALPRHFLAKVLQKLVRRELLLSAKGRRGGFILARPAETITLYEIVQAIDGAAAFRQCVVGLTRCDDQQPCPQHDAWKMLRGEIYEFLQATTVQCLAETLREKLRLLDAPNPAQATAPDTARA